jgi:hypothetical protein
MTDQSRAEDDKVKAKICVFTVAVGASLSVFAECRSTLQDSDKEADVKRNLQCFAEQVSELKIQLANQQAQLQALQQEKMRGLTSLLA